jgi:hypothetical protein
MPAIHPDDKKYTFIHEEYGETYSSINELSTTYDLPHYDLVKMVVGCKSQVNGWRILR